MNRSYRLTPLAETDLEAIWLYSYENWGKEKADSYYHSMVATFESIIEGQKQAHEVSFFPDCQKVFCGAHVIYYLVTDLHIDVIRILHQKQDVELNLMGFF